MTEEQLAIRARDGDEQAFAELAYRMRGLAHHIIEPYFGPGLEDEDLLQAALLGLWGACRNYDREVVGPTPGASFAAFAIFCMRRSAISAVKLATRLKHRPLAQAVSLDRTPGDDGDEGDSFHDLLATRDAGPLEQVLAREQLDVVLETVRERLTPLEREIATGIMNGEAYHEIGGRLGLRVYERANGRCRSKPVDNALQRARRKVLAALGEDVRRRPLGVAA